MKNLPVSSLFSFLLLCSGGGLMAQTGGDGLDEQAGEKLIPPVDKEFLPLDVLPPGTVLNKVRLPRYRGGLMLGEVIADQLKIISGSLVEGQTVDVFWRTGQDEEILTKAILPAATYDFKLGLMKAQGGVAITDPRFVAEGREMDLNLSLRRGWLAPPVRTQFFRRPEGDARVDRNQKDKMKTGKLLKPGLMGVGLAYCMAAPPSEPTSDEWAKSEELTSQRSSSELAPDDKEIRLFEEAVSLDRQADEARSMVGDEIKKDEALGAKAQRRMNEFLEQIGRETIKTAETVSDVQSVEDADVLGEPLKVPQLDPAVKVLEVKSTGGMFFDAEEGVFVYNDKTQVRDPEFSLDCSKQLKVFLAPKVVAEGEEAKPGEFGELSKIAATGNVVVVTTNKKGEKMVATAEKMTYDAATSVIILRGGYLTVRQGNNFTEVKGPGSYIKFSETKGAVAKGVINQRLVKPPKKNN